MEMVLLQLMSWLHFLPFNRNSNNIRIAYVKNFCLYVLIYTYLNFSNLHAFLQGANYK